MADTGQGGTPVTITSTTRADLGRIGLWAGLAGLLLLAFVSYLPALQGGFIWDDDDYVSENPLLRDADGLRRIWTTTESPQYYPLVFTSFWVEHHLWGLEPAGYHAVNVALHALNAFLIGLLLRTLRVRGAWWVAVLFARAPGSRRVGGLDHRAQERALRPVLPARPCWPTCASTGTGNAGSMSWPWALFLCALLSKTVAATLPVVILLVLLYRGKRVSRRDLLRLLPFFVLALGMGMVTVALEEEMVGVVGGEFEFGPLQRALIACRALLFYAGKLLFPWPLIFNYPRWNPDAGFLVWLGPVCAVLAAAGSMLFLWRRGRRGTVLALLFFAVTLFPALGLFNVYPFRYSFVADHFQYLASVGILVLTVQAVILLAEAAARRWVSPDGDRPRAAERLATAAGLLVAAMLAALTWSQAGDYRDLETLWRATIARNPSSWIAHNNLALILLDRGEIEAAVAGFDRALESNPNSAESHTGRAMARARLGRNECALDDLDRALELDPTYPQAYIHRGELHLEMGEYARAVEDLGRVLASNPDYLEAYRFRALAFQRLGEPDRAVADLTEAIRRGANYQALNDRGVAHVQAGDHEAALADFDAAIPLSPNPLEIVHNRGVAYANLGRHEEALADFAQVLAGDPRAVNTWVVRGNLLLTVRGDREAACADWRQACRLGECHYFRAHCPDSP